MGDMGIWGWGWRRGDATWKLLGSNCANANVNGRELCCVGGAAELHTLFEIWPLTESRGTRESFKGQFYGARIYQLLVVTYYMRNGYAYNICTTYIPRSASWVVSFCDDINLS